MKAGPRGKPSEANENTKATFAKDMHTAINIALFPPLFFLSGLFYTDVLSTAIVLRMYRVFLRRDGAYKNTGEGLVWLIPTGLVALTMRQTNIFWAVIFLGGLELVRTIERFNPVAVLPEPSTWSWREFLSQSFRRFKGGEIHDVPLSNAGLQGMDIRRSSTCRLTCNRLCSLCC